MLILDTLDSYNQFKSDYSTYDWFILPVYESGNVPVHTDSISILYVYVILKDVTAIVVINHTESINNIPINQIDFPLLNNCYVYEMKAFMSKKYQSNFIDIDLIKYFKENTIFEDSYDTSAHIWFSKTYVNFKYLNTIIPIYKHVERCELIRNDFLELWNDPIINDNSFKYYNALMLPTLYNIERSGIAVNSNVFNSFFPGKSTFDGLVYSEYNPYTTTSRPSNNYDGVNFAALNKESGVRSSLISRFDNGYLVNFDYDAYHIRLMAGLVGYEFPEDISVHEYLGRLYFNTNELTESQYDKSKQMSFKLIYGSGIHEYLHINFFKKIHEFTKALWSEFNSNLKIESALFKRPLCKRFFTDMNSTKLLNYYLQNFETERNMLVLSKLLTLPVASKTILYTYDSVLVDFNVNDGAEFLTEYKKILETGNYPVKIAVGSDYNNMIKYSLPV